MIRRAIPTDAAQIAAIEAAGAHQPWSESSVVGHLALPTTLALLCPSGHILTSVIADEAEVLTVVVHPRARRKGLGRRLVEAAHSAWEEAGVARAFLEVRRDNAAAIALYVSLGWRERGVRPAYYRDGTDALLYELDLTSGGT